MKVKQFVAIVYKQHTPIPNGKTFTYEGEKLLDHTANLKEVGKVTGSWEECWKQAKEMVPFPVVEFKEVHHGKA